jgi:hypothetical protein
MNNKVKKKKVNPIKDSLFSTKNEKIRYLIFLKLFFLVENLTYHHSYFFYIVTLLQIH